MLVFGPTELREVDTTTEDREHSLDTERVRPALGAPLFMSDVNISSEWNDFRGFHIFSSTSAPLGIEFSKIKLWKKQNFITFEHIIGTKSFTLNLQNILMIMIWRVVASEPYTEESYNHLVLEPSPDKE